jgi:hypothetical protein
MVNLSSATAPHGIEGDQLVPMAARCDEHNPYMVKCVNGHYNWIDHRYCGYCGVQLQPTPFEQPVRGKS